MVRPLATLIAVGCDWKYSERRGLLGSRVGVGVGVGGRVGVLVAVGIRVGVIVAVGIRVGVMVGGDGVKVGGGLVRNLRISRRLIMLSGTSSSGARNLE